MMSKPEVRTISGFVLTKAVPGAAVFAATPYWVNRVGFSEYIIYSTGWAMATLVAGFFSAWINQSVLRNTGVGNAGFNNLPVPALFGTLVFAGASAGLLGSLVALGASGFTTWTVAGVSVLAAANTFGSIQAAVLQRELLSGAIAWVLGIRTLGAVIISVALIEVWKSTSGDAIVWSFAAASVLSVIYAKVKYSAAVSGSGEKSARVLRKFWKYGWPMSIWAAASTAVLYSDRIALSLAIGAEEAGSYAAIADIIVRGFALVAFPITMYAHPIIMRAANLEDDSLRKTINRMLLLVIAVVLFSGAACGLIVILGSRMVNLEYSVSSLGVWLIVIGAGAWQVALVTHKFMEVQNRTRELAFIIVFIALVSFSANFGYAQFTGKNIAPVVFCISAVTYCLLTYFLGAARQSTSTERAGNV